MSEPSPEAAHWLTEARSGSKEALGRLLEGCRAYLLLVAERELDPELRAKGGASDVVQETLLDAVRDFGQFQGVNETELLAWLRRMLLNNLVSFTRLFRATGKRQVGREVTMDAGGSSGGGVEPHAHDPTGSELLAAAEDAEAIRKAVEQMPDDYRRVLLLRYQENQSFEEIGQALGLTANAAGKLCMRAVKRLQQEMKGSS